MSEHAPFLDSYDDSPVKEQLLQALYHANSLTNHLGASLQALSEGAESHKVAEDYFSLALIAEAIHRWHEVLRLKLDVPDKDSPDSGNASSTKSEAPRPRRRRAKGGAQ